MRYILLPGSPQTSSDLWLQCLSGSLTDLLLCCDDGVVKCHKAVLSTCAPWLANTDTDTVIMPGVEVASLQEVLKLFYLTGVVNKVKTYFNFAEMHLSSVASHEDQKMEMIVKIEDLDWTLQQDGHVAEVESLDEEEFAGTAELGSLAVKKETFASLSNKEKYLFVEDVVCSVCGKELPSRKALKGHMMVHDSNYGKCECDVCGKLCATIKSLKDHKRTQHEGFNNFPCEVCGKLISTPRGLREHIKRVHDKIFDKECPHCEYRAAANIDIKKHIEASHLGITYPCDKCDMTFNQYSTLYSHKSVHSEERRFVCQKCGTGFKKKKGLERHIETIHSTSTYPCKVCGKVFKSEAYLSDHMRAHDEDRQFPCSFCKRRFVTKTKLRMHINTHTGERPYKCPFNCDKAFHSSDQLSHHKKQCQFQ